MLYTIHEQLEATNQNSMFLTLFSMRADFGRDCDLRRKITQFADWKHARCVVTETNKKVFDMKKYFCLAGFVKKSFHYQSNLLA